MPASIFSDTLTWSQERPAWQRDALRRLFTSGAVTPEDLDELTEICRAQRSLTHHSGVNALASEQTVSFGLGLTIVYGENAAGNPDIRES